MPVKAPVINTTGFAHIRFLMISCFLPTGHGLSRRETDKGPRDVSKGTSVIEQVGTASVLAQDFISWWACLRDMEAEMELRHLRYFVAVAEEGSLTLAAEKTVAHRAAFAEPANSRSRYEVLRSVYDTQRAWHRIDCRR